MSNILQSDNKIGVLIADDHYGVRFGLKSYFEQFHSDAIKVVGEAVNAIEAYEMCKQLKPDVLIIDMQYDTGGPPGTDTIVQLRTEAFPIAIIALTGNAFMLKNITGILDAGADFCFDKVTSFSEVAKQVLSLGENSARFKKFTAPIYILADPNEAEVANISQIKNRLSKLTVRELELLLELADAKSNIQIATDFCISPRTVGNHLYNIYQKLELKSRTRTEAGIFANSYRALIDSALNENE